MAIFTSGPGTVASDANLSLSDVTTGDVSTSKHGFVPKAPNDTSKFLCGDGSFVALSTTKATFATSFDTAGRYVSTLTGAGTASFNTNGLTLTLTTGTTDSASVTWALGGGGAASVKLFSGSPLVSVGVCVQAPSDIPNNATAYFGINPVTVSGSGHTFTDRHIGFKLVKAAGSISLYGTQANGTTETATSALTTLDTAYDIVDLIFKVNGTSSVDYYYRKNGGSLSSATNLTTNLPTTNGNDYLLQFSVSKNSAGGSFGWGLGVSGASYTR